MRISQMQHVKNLTYALLLVVLASSVGGQTLARRAFPAELDQYIEKARVDWSVPGLAIAVVDADGVVAAKGYGVRRLGSNEPVDADTKFDIASVSKSFTAAMIATLVDEGKLTWDARVRDVLPAVVFPDAYLDREVTLRDLLAHRVALEPGNLMFRLTDYDRAEVFRRIRFLKPRGAFRSDYVYSNIMYTVAGAMAEAVTGQSWTALVQSRLLDPLGMTASNAAGTLTGPNAASPHAVIHGAQQPIAHRDFMVVAPAAAVVSTARDMTKWLQFQLVDGTWNGKRIISAHAMEEMHSPQIIIRTTPGMRAARGVEFFAGYGFGWNVMDYRGHAMLWHSGNADGMPVYMAILPKEKIGVAVMVNTWGAPVLHGAIASRIFDTMLGLLPRDWSGEALAATRREDERETQRRAAIEKQRIAGAPPSLPLSAYSGTYVDPRYGDITIRMEENRPGPSSTGLTLQVAKGAVAALEPWQHDVFRVLWRDPVFAEDYATFATFTIDESGQPQRLDVPINRDRIEARRRPRAQ